MNDESNIQGSWTGTIVYGKRYLELENAILYFEMEIFQSGNTISGTSIDIAGPGTSPDSANISGTYAEGQIAFVKQYASLHYLKKAETIVDRRKAGFKIQYSGTFDKNAMAFMGDWTIKARFWFLGLIPFSRTAKGTWTMRRK